MIDEWVIGKDSERNRKILKRRLLDGITFDSLAYEFNMSTQNVTRIVYKYQDKVFRHIK